MLKRITDCFKKQRKLFMHGNRQNIVILFASSMLCFLVIPLLINFLFTRPAICKIFAVKWEASDALGYVGGALTFVGTVFLGWISWKQNQELQKRQDETFIAENSCSVLLDNIEVRNMAYKAVNLNIHPETIAIADFPDQQTSDYGSLECDITLYYEKNRPVIVRVREAFIQIGNYTATFHKYDDFFTRVAGGADVSRFKLSLIMPSSEKNEIKAKIDAHFRQIMLDITMEVVSERYVSTLLKCRSTLTYHESCGQIKYVSNKEHMMCFWYGNSILSSSGIEFRCGSDASIQ